MPTSGAGLSGLEAVLWNLANSLSWIAPNPQLYFAQQGIRALGLPPAIVGGATLGMGVASIAAMVQANLAGQTAAAFKSQVVGGAGPPQQGFSPLQYQSRVMQQAAQYNIAPEQFPQINQGLAEAGIFGAQNQLGQALKDTATLTTIFGLTVSSSTDLLKTAFTNLGMSSGQISNFLDQIQQSSAAAQVPPQTVAQLLSNNPNILANLGGATNPTQATKLATTALASTEQVFGDSNISALYAGILGNTSQSGVLPGYTSRQAMNQDLQQNPTAVEDRLTQLAQKLSALNPENPQLAMQIFNADVSSLNVPGQVPLPQLNLPEFEQVVRTPSNAITTASQHPNPQLGPPAPTPSPTTYNPLTWTQELKLGIQQMSDSIANGPPSGQGNGLVNALKAAALAAPVGAAGGAAGGAMFLGMGAIPGALIGGVGAAVLAAIAEARVGNSPIVTGQNGTTPSPMTSNVAANRIPLPTSTPVPPTTATAAAAYNASISQLMTGQAPTPPLHGSVNVNIQVSQPSGTVQSYQTPVAISTAQQQTSQMTPPSQRRSGAPIPSPSSTPTP